MSQKGFTTFSSHERGLAPILIVILLAAALMGGYLIYQNQAKTIPSPQPTPSTSSGQTTQPSPTPDPTVNTESDRSANWKTFVNKKYNYQIKFPAVYDAYGISTGYEHSSIFSPENADTVVIVKLKTKVQPKDERDIDQTVLTIGEDSPNLKGDFNTLLNDSTDPNFSEKHRLVKIGNELGDEYVSWYKGQLTAKYILFTHNSTFFVIDYGNVEDKYVPNYPNNIEDQILSTFKFLDQK